MSMDETMQQNAALVEEITSAAQSMKEQARELMRQVEVFKLNGTGEASHVKAASTLPASMSPRVVRGEREAPKSRETSHVKREASGSGTKPASRDTLHVAKPAGVAAGNGKDRRSSSGDDFEEF